MVLFGLLLLGAMFVFGAIGFVLLMDALGVESADDLTEFEQGLENEAFLVHYNRAVRARLEREWVESAIASEAGDSDEF